MPFALDGTKVVCRLGHEIAADKGNSLVRHARTAHRAAAHYAWLTLKEGGKTPTAPAGLRRDDVSSRKIV